MGVFRFYRFVLLFLFGITFGIHAREAEEIRMRVMFWNVENLFDCRDDSLKADQEYLPDSPRRWTFHRYRQKLINTAKVIVAAGEGEIPVLVGLCEVENDSVLEDLQRLTPLRQLGYRHFITQSPDPRGINVALLYKRDRFKPVSRKDHRVTLPDRYKPTRDILQVTGVLPGGDTLDLFLCHFPSRSGGEAESRPARIAASQKLTEVINTVNNLRTNPHILICGDMNDYPSTLCIPTSNKQDTSVYNFVENIVNNNLFNLMGDLEKSGGGTHKFNGKWGYLDQFIVNGRLLDKYEGPYVEKAAAFSAPFMLTEDTKHLGKRPKRTYYGYKYEGGYSDHLPIILDLVVKRSF